MSSVSVSALLSSSAGLELFFVYQVGGSFV